MAAVVHHRAVVHPGAEHPAGAQGGEVPRARHYHPLREHQNADGLLYHCFACQVSNAPLCDGDELVDEIFCCVKGSIVPCSCKPEGKGHGSTSYNVAVRLIDRLVV